MTDWHAWSASIVTCDNGPMIMLRGTGGLLCDTQGDMEGYILFPWAPCYTTTVKAKKYDKGWLYF